MRRTVRPHAEEAVPHESPHRIGGDPEQLKGRLAEQLSLLLIRRERELGRPVGRDDLARRISVSKSSLYAYLKGTTLPRPNVLDRLLEVLGADASEMRALSTLRDTIELSRPRTRALREAPAARGAVPVPLPRQLPPVTARFTGRGAELGRLDRILGEADAADPVVITIDGTAGVGKTTLALRWAHQVKHRYPDGQLHVNLRGFAPEGPTGTGEALHGFVQSLGTAPQSIPSDLDAKAALFRSLLAERRMLIVVDNAASAADVRPLLPGSGSCLVIVTSRNRLDSLMVHEGAHRVTLDVLPHRDALSLMERWLGRPPLTGQADAADELVGLCARLPLAVSIVAARAAGNPEVSLEPLARQLREGTGRLDVLGAATADLDLRTVLQASYAALPDAAARLFRLLGAFAGPDIGAHACAALLGVRSPPRAELDALTGAHMLTEQAGGRFSSHDLLRALAREAAELEEEKERRGATERVLDYYLCTALRAGRRIEPCRASELPGAGPGPPGPRIDDYVSAMAWFTTELPSLRAATEQAAAEGFDDHAWRLARAATVFLRRTGRRAERVALHRTALPAATRTGDRVVQATSMRLLADGLARVGEHAKAKRLLHSCLWEFRTAGDARGVFQTHLSLTRVHDSAGEHAEALGHAEEALRSADGVGGTLALADGLAAVTEQRERAGRCAEALPLGRRALELYRGLDYAEGEAVALRTLGRVELGLGRTRRATALFERSLELDRLLGDRYWEARVLDDLAGAHEAAGDQRRARERREEAAAMFASMRRPTAAGTAAGFRPG